MALNPSLPLVLHTQLDCNSTNWGSRPQGHWAQDGSTIEAQRPKVKNSIFELIIGQNGKFCLHHSNIFVFKVLKGKNSEHQLKFFFSSRDFGSQVVPRAGAREKAAALGPVSRLNPALPLNGFLAT